jgi:hypothetical protein
MIGVAWKIPDSKGKKKEQSQAVLTYLENKLQRHESELPKYDAVLALYPDGWKYAGTFPDEGGRVGYRIVIRQIARVIHVHLQGTQIDRAHFIHKLAEQEKKTEAKLSGMEAGKLTAGQEKKFEDRYPRTRLEENVPALGSELRKVYDQQKASGRHEAIIFNASAPVTKRFGYCAGAYAKELLKKIRDLINANAGAGTVTGAAGLTLV